MAAGFSERDATPMIATRNDAGEAALSLFVGAILIGGAFWFRTEIEVKIGQTATTWALYISLLLYAVGAISTVFQVLDFLFWESSRRKRELEDKRELAKLEAERNREQAEYDSFLKWAAQNPKTVDRLLAIVDHEQIDDARYFSYVIERREREGVLTDLPRLFNWLKARRELQKFGIDPPLPPFCGDKPHQRGGWPPSV
jgi:hypothetical protein